MKKLLLLITTVFLGNISFSQTCGINITTLPSQVCPGSTINLNATGFVTGSNYAFNFNGGVLPPGWSTAGSTNYNNYACGPSLDNSNYFWASTAVGTPQIGTDELDICSGGTIKFDMKYAVQGGPSPCEGPDLANEGVSVQYKVGGGPWIDFIYYRPDGQILTSCPSGSSPSISGPTIFTVWNTFTVPIPAAAVSTNTRFRWIQKNSSGTCCDNWGLDNIFINAGPCVSANIDWSNGTQSNENTSIVANNDTCMIAYLYDDNNVLLCTSDPVCFTVFDPNIEAGVDQEVCLGQNVTVSGSLGTNFVWDNNVTNGVPYTPSATQTLHVSGTDLNGCFATDSLLVTVNPIMPLGLSYPETEYCNSAANPTPTVTGSAAGTYTISPATMTINSTTGILNLASSTVSTSETYTITYTPSEPCFAATTFDVTVYSLPTATITSDVTVCQNDIEPLLTLTGSNATAPYTFSYQINGGATQTANSTGSVLPITVPTTSAGSFTYTLTGVSESGPKACSNTLNQSVTVTINPAPVFTTTTNQAICFGDSVVLTSTGATSYTWSDGIVNGVPFYPQTTKTYSVTATGANNCTGEQLVTVIVNALPEIDAGPDQKVCVGSPVRVTGSEGVSYVWTGGVTDGIAFYPTLGDSMYYVIGTDANGCKNIDSVTIKAIAAVIAGIDADPITGYPGLVVDFTNESLYGTYFQWNFGNGSTTTTTNSNGTTATYPNPGVYEVTIKAFNAHCDDTAKILITVLPFPDPIITVPNVFTPNGDNANDVWWIDVQWGKTIEVQIFNRWGNLMTEMDDFSDRWNGKSNDNTDASDGVYFYKYIIVDLNDKTYDGHGHITLQR